MDTITIVCCFNDAEAYESLTRSIYDQDCDAVILGVNNSDSSFKSCSSAYNSVLKLIQTKYVAFVHQDIVFLHADSIRKMVSFLNDVDQVDIIGVAGAKEDGKYNRKVLSNIVHGNNMESAGDHFNGIEKCMTLDECLIFGYTDYFVCNPFDETICDNWHLYSVEQCLRTSLHGGQPYVCEIDLFHKSKGRVSSSYVLSFFKLCYRYRKDYPYITTCCASSRTSLPHLLKTCLIIEGSIIKRKILKRK